MSSITALDITTTNSRPAETAGRKRRRTSPAVKCKYNAATYDNIQIRIARGSKSAIQIAAAEHGMSMAAYITAAINTYAGYEIVPPLSTNPYI